MSYLLMNSMTILIVLPLDTEKLERYSKFPVMIKKQIKSKMKKINDSSGLLTYESFNPYLGDFFTIQRSYDTKGIKTVEFADNDQDGEFDEYIIYNNQGSKQKRYLDQNKDHRFDESEIVD